MKNTTTPLVWPFPSRTEAAFADNLLRLHLRIGVDAAGCLLRDMTEAVADGADQRELRRFVSAALYAARLRH